MTISTILLVVLILLVLGALPSWPHARNWGYGPSGLLGTVLIVLLILMFMGRIQWLKFSSCTPILGVHFQMT